MVKSRSVKKIGAKNAGGAGERQRHFSRPDTAPFPKSRASYFRFARFNTSALYYLRARLSLLRNQTETLAIGISLSLSQMSNPSCSLVNAIAQSKEIPAPILTQFPFSIFSNVFLACVASVSVRFRSKERGTS